MRVLLTGLPIQSHLVPLLVPLAQALRDRGHEVAIATGEAVAADLERRGVAVVRLPDVLAPHQVASRPNLPVGAASALETIRRWRPEVTGPLSVPLFDAAMTAASAANLIDAAKEWRPDLIVRETNEYGGYLAADVLGVPLALVDIAPLITRLIPDLTERLNAVRETFGLPAVRSSTHAYGRLAAGLLPERWYPDALRTSVCRSYRAPDVVDDAPLDLAIADLPGDVPLVLASIGSNAYSLLSRESELMSIMVAALGSLPVRAVVALGSDQARDSWRGPRPANVHLVSFGQQPLLLGACDLFVTHAGFSGVRESLGAGVPMVAVPLFADQPANAARIDDLGLGVRVDVGGLTQDALAAAVSRVLDTSRYRLATRGFQRRILGLPPFTAFVTDLEHLVTGHG